MAEEDDLMQLAMDMSSYCSDTTLTTRAAPEKIRCYAYVHEDGLCLRANSLVTYCEANRQVKCVSFTVPLHSSNSRHLPAQAW